MRRVLLLGNTGCMLPVHPLPPRAGDHARCCRLMCCFTLWPVFMPQPSGVISVLVSAGLAELREHPHPLSGSPLSYTAPL